MDDKLNCWNWREFCSDLQTNIDFELSKELKVQINFWKSFKSHSVPHLKSLKIENHTNEVKTFSKMLQTKLNWHKLL